MNTIEVGRKYKTEKNMDFECILVKDGMAWMHSGGAATAYVWNIDGGSVSLGDCYNVIWPNTPRAIIIEMLRDIKTANAYYDFETTIERAENYLANNP